MHRRGEWPECMPGRKEGLLKKDEGSSYSFKVKEELVRLPMGKSCCQLSEIGSLTQTSGHLSFRGRGLITVQYRLEHIGAVRRLFRLLKARLGVSPILHYTQTRQLGGRRTWALSLDEKDSRTLLSALHMIEEDEKGQVVLKRTVPRHPLTRQCCRKAFFRGAFLGAGSVTNPERGYHMEWRAEDDRLAETMRKLMEKNEIPFHSYQRKDQTVIYLKEADQIVKMLAMMGASGSVLKLENIRIGKQTRLQANRAANCDEHNGERMLEAAEKQAAACMKISLKRGLFTLPPALREIARARLEHPEMSLTELGGMMDPPLSKSAVNHRLRRLMEIAEGME